MQVPVFTPDRLEQMTIYRWKEPTGTTIQPKAQAPLTHHGTLYFSGCSSFPSELVADLFFLYSS